MPDEISDFDVIEAMERYGGAFTSRLAVLWRYADLLNQARLKAAFPDLWEQYRGLAVLKRKQTA